MQTIPIILLMAQLMILSGCSKPENELIGKWSSDRTASVMEFNKDMTGIAQLKSSSNQQKAVPFTWTMQGDKDFTVQFSLPGTSVVRSGKGVVQGKGEMVLEDDPFRKTK